MPPKATPKTPENPPAEPVPGQAELTETDPPETLETLAARADHADNMIHTALTMLSEQQQILVEVRAQLVPDGGQPILPVIHAQLVQVDAKQNGAAGLLQSTFEAAHKLSDLFEQYRPLLDHAEKFIANPVTAYLETRKAGRRTRGQDTTV